jgi:hypothetical protein
MPLLKNPIIPEIIASPRWFVAHYSITDFPLKPNSV